MNKIVLLVGVFIIFFAQFAVADIIYLKNGNTYEGRIVKEDDEKLAVKTTIMTIVLSKDEIKGIQRDYPDSDSRLGTGEKFNIIDVLKEKDESSDIKVIQKEDANLE